MWCNDTIKYLKKKTKFQFTTLRVNVSNHTLHADLHLKTVSEIALIMYKRFHCRLVNHSNPFISHLNSDTMSGNHPWKLK